MIKRQLAWHFALMLRQSEEPETILAEASDLLSQTERLSGCQSGWCYMYVVSHPPCQAESVLTSRMGDDIGRGNFGSVRYDTRAQIYFF